METEDFDPTEYEETDIEPNFESDAIGETSSNPELSEISEQDLADRHEQQEEVEATISTSENFITEGNFEASSGKIFLEGQEIISDDPEMESLLIQNFNQGVEGVFYSKTFDLGGDLYQIDYILYGFDENGASLRLDSKLISKGEEEGVAPEELYEYSNDDEISTATLTPEANEFVAEIQNAEDATETVSTEAVEQTETTVSGWFGIVETAAVTQENSENQVSITELGFNPIFSTATLENNFTEPTKAVADNLIVRESSPGLNLFGFIETFDTEINNKAVTFKNEAASSSREQQTITTEIISSTTATYPIKTLEQSDSITRQPDTQKTELKETGVDQEESTVEQEIEQVKTYKAEANSQPIKLKPEKTSKAEGKTVQVEKDTLTTNNNSSERERAIDITAADKTPTKIVTNKQKNNSVNIQATTENSNKFVEPQNPKPSPEPTIDTPEQTQSISLRQEVVTAQNEAESIKLNVAETEKVEPEKPSGQTELTAVVDTIQEDTQEQATVIQIESEEQMTVDQNTAAAENLEPVILEANTNTEKTPGAITEPTTEVVVDDTSILEISNKQIREDRNNEVEIAEPAIEQMFVEVEKFTESKQVTEKNNAQIKIPAQKSEKIQTQKTAMERQLIGKTRIEQKQRIERPQIQKRNEKARTERQPIRLVKKNNSSKAAESKTRLTNNNRRTSKPTELYSVKRQIKKVVVTGKGFERNGGISLRSNVASITSDLRDRLEQTNRISRIPTYRARRRTPNQSAIKIAA